MRHSPVYWHVAPRFTAGSPAQVDEATALHVAREEDQAYVAQRFADRQPFTDPTQALQGIVYASHEHGKLVTVRDELTEQFFEVPLAEWSGQHWYARTDRDRFLRR